MSQTSQEYPDGYQFEFSSCGSSTLSKSDALEQQILTRIHDQMKDSFLSTSVNGDFQYLRQDDDEDFSEDFRPFLKMKNQILEAILIKNRVPLTRLRLLKEQQPLVVEAIFAYLSNLLSEEGFNKIQMNLSQTKRVSLRLRLADFKRFGAKEQYLAHYKRQDGKNKSMHSCALKTLKNLWMAEATAKGTFKQSTNPEKHVLQCEIHARIYQELLDPKWAIKEVPRERKFQVEEGQQKIITKKPPKEGKHNLIFSLVHKGGLSKRWVDLVKSCPRWKTFLTYLIKVLNSRAFLDQYEQKIKSMISVLKYDKAGRPMMNGKDLLTAIMNRLPAEDRVTKANYCKMPDSILEVKHHRDRLVDKIRKIIDEDDDEE